MAFALPRAEFDKLIEQLKLLEQNGDANLRHQCLKRTHAICNLLAMGDTLEAQVTKLLDAGNAGRAAVLVEAFAGNGAMAQRLKFSKMFS